MISSLLHAVAEVDTRHMMQHKNICDDNDLSWKSYSFNHSNFPIKLNWKRLWAIKMKPSTLRHIQKKKHEITIMIFFSFHLNSFFFFLFYAYSFQIKTKKQYALFASLFPCLHRPFINFFKTLKLSESHGAQWKN